MFLISLRAKFCEIPRPTEGPTEVFLKNQNKQNNNVSQPAGRMSLGILISRISGFLRDLCIAGFFSKTETDIFFVAFRFPNFFRKLIGEGSFTSSVTPALAELLQKPEGKNKAKNLNSYLFSLIFCLSGTLSLLGMYFMEDIMNLFFAGSAYDQIEGKLQKTILVGRLVFSYLFFVSLYSYFTSTIQVFGRFFLPAIAPAFLNLSLIAFSWTPESWWPFPALSLGWAVILGGLLQLLPVIYELKRLNLIPRWTFRYDPSVLHVGRRFLPGLLALSGLSLISLINVYFAGRLQEGAPSYIYYGDRLLEFPRALIAVSIGTALIPELARLFAKNQIVDFKNTISFYLRLSLFLILPCALIFFISAEPLVQLIFGRGKFDTEAIANTSDVLRIYSVVLIFSSLSHILSSGFFALNKNWFVAFCALGLVCSHTIFAQILSTLYGLKGLVGAGALSSMLYFFFLTGFLLHLIGDLKWKAIVSTLLKSLPGLFLLGICLALFPILEGFLSLFLPAPWPFMLFPVLLVGGGGLYLLSGWGFKEEMAFEFLDLFQKTFFWRRKGPWSHNKKSQSLSPSNKRRI